ncbi:MAG TPA: DNA-directed RNA polymerase subunit D [Methanospirillum sp.]|nr:DNA-directed RNA polymerase subunit D [Methanospirillum sp.]
MNIDFSSLDENSTSFVLSESYIAFANALRRAMQSEVMSFAFEKVRIYDNTSALFDEILTHRLGLIPLTTDLQSYIPQDTCSCEGKGCPQCTVALTMSVEGPCMVVSGDLISQDPAVHPASDNIPIVKLEKNQKVVLEAYAILNRGFEHAKWQPVTVCGYKNYPLIIHDTRCDGCGICVEVCPKNILEVKGGKVAVITGGDIQCSLCRLCEQACLNSGIGEDPAIHIKMDETRFIFNMESDGSLPAVEILEQGLLYLKNQSDGLLEALSEIRG